MQTNNIPPNGANEAAGAYSAGPAPGRGNRFSFGGLFRDLGATAKNMLRSEVDLAVAELRGNLKETYQLTVKAALFGALAGLSALPFLAFLVIGLGELLGERYWLSSLIVSLVCAVGGGIPAYRAYQRLVNHEFSFHRTKENLEQQQRVVRDQVENLKDATLRRAV